LRRERAVGKWAVGWRLAVVSLFTTTSNVLSPGSKIGFV